MNRLSVVFVRVCRAQEKLQQRVAKYFVMLTEGCGNEDCVNEDCASYKRAHGTPESIPPPNKAAVSAVRLLQEKRKLCSESKPVSDRTVNGRRQRVCSPTPSDSHPSSVGRAVVGRVEADPNGTGGTSNMDVVQQQDGHHIDESMEMSPQQVVEAVQETRRGGSVMVGSIEMQDRHPSSKAVNTGVWGLRAHMDLF